MKYSTLLVMMTILGLGGCKTQQKTNKIESDSQGLSRSQLVGAWRTETPPATDPPMDYTLRLEANGDFTMSLRLKQGEAYIPLKRPSGSRGYWYYARLDETHDALITIAKNPEAGDIEIREIFLNEDQLILKPLPRDRDENRSMDEAWVMKRVMQE